MPGLFSGLDFNRDKASEAQDEWMKAYNARDRSDLTQEEMNRLAAEEHSKYAEFRVTDRPVLGFLEQLFGIPAWTLAKKFGILDGRSDSSLDEMAEGYRGLGRGIQNTFTGRRPGD